MNTQTSPENPPRPDGDRQARDEARRAETALDNVREGYGEMNPLSPQRAIPDPTPHGQRPARQQRSDTDRRPGAQDD